MDKDVRYYYYGSMKSDTNVGFRIPKQLLEDFKKVCGDSLTQKLKDLMVEEIIKASPNK